MQNVLNALRVLDEVAARQPVGVSDLARALELPKSTVQRALLTLREAGWLRQTEDGTGVGAGVGAGAGAGFGAGAGAGAGFGAGSGAGGGAGRWVLTTKPLLFGRHGTGELGLRDVAVPVMEDLRSRCDETVHLAVPEGGKVVLIERLETSQPVRIILPLGKNLPLHASANGKAVLAAGSPEDIERHLTEELPHFTDTTVTEPGKLRDELAAIRERGYATNDGEWRTDVSATASAVIGPSGGPVASISINVPSSRLTSESRMEHARLVREAAERVGSALGGGSSRRTP